MIRARQAAAVRGGGPTRACPGWWAHAVRSRTGAGSPAPPRSAS